MTASKTSSERSAFAREKASACGEKRFHQLRGRCEVHAATGVDKRMAQRATEMAPAAAGEREEEHVGCAVEERASRELLDFEEGRPWDPSAIERFETLARR